MAKILVVIIFFLILGSLGSGLFYLIRDKGQGTRTARALTIRIGLSIALFILLFVLFATGQITPHGVG
ncbi:MAG: twin transmembrane helix small protein [Gammaproteobacteria bacterium]|nr:twin transmembrane helix small protein [Gammaproteobacteria bacterium]